MVIPELLGHFLGYIITLLFGCLGYVVLRQFFEKMTTNLKRKREEGYYNQYNPNYDNKRRNVGDSKVENNISKLVNAVLSQGELGKLVIIQDVDQDEKGSAYVTLQNCLQCINMNLDVIRNPASNPSKQQSFELQINGIVYAEGTFQNIQLARKPLAEEALRKLKETCFLIYKKKNYVNVTKENLHGQASTSSSSNDSVKPQVPVESGSIAHKIMMKMGWTGGGLGAQEQGDIDAVVLCENVNRQGLGSLGNSSNLMKEITNKLAEFSRSSNLLSLVFDADFTKEERMMIHKAARKFNLKSKSTGSDDSRKLTISKKLTRIDIVKELLRIGGEDGLYKLQIPTKFAHLWKP